MKCRITDYQQSKRQPDSCRGSKFLFIATILGVTAAMPLPVLSATTEPVSSAATEQVSSATAEQPGFQLHGRFEGIGGSHSRLIGPGPKPGSQRLYVAHSYNGNKLDVLAIDPLTGKFDAFPGPIPVESGVWGMALDADGNLYIGTCPLTASILRLDWQKRKLVNMGRPSKTEQYIWQLALGTDKKLYGCTYPNAKLVRFDPATGKGEDLGRMDPKELYARSVAADDKGFVYVGIGMNNRNIVAYEIATGKHRSILPAKFAGRGSCSVWRAKDGKVYGRSRKQLLRLEGWNAIAITKDQVPEREPLRLADGRTVTYDGRNTVSITNPTTGKVITHKTDYKGKSKNFWRIGLGPDGRIYGNPEIPNIFIWADPDSQRWEKIGVMGPGENYSLLTWKDSIICAAYCGLGKAPIMIYRPGKPWAPSRKPSGNPWLIHYSGENQGWRPLAMIAGPNDKVYIGSVPGYGLLGGSICVLDPVTGQVEEYKNVIHDQSIRALALLPDGRIIGGTMTAGGCGSFPTQPAAKLFLWDPIKRKKLFETVPAPGVSSIEALAVGKDGMVYGFAGKMFFVFDPKEQKVITLEPHNLGGNIIFNTVVEGPEGKLYGLCSKGIFSIDTATRRPYMLAPYSKITAGVAIRGRQIFFTAGPQIVSYTLP